MVKKTKSLPESWKWVKIKDISEKSQYGFTTKAVDQGDTHLLRTTDITNGPVNWETVPYCREDPDDIKKYELKEDDILISRAGSVGKSYLVSNLPQNNVVFASYLIRFKPKIESNLFKYFLESPQYWNAITEEKSGIAVPNVNATKLNAINFPLPPADLRHRIVEKIEELFSELDYGVESLKKAQKQLKTYRQAVLKDAFEGKLTKKWRERQTGLPSPEELLQQIKAERKAHREHQLAEWEKEVEQWEKDGKPGRKPRKPSKLCSAPDLTDEEIQEFPQLPKEWSWFRIGNLSNDIQIGPFGSLLHKKDYIKNGIPVINPSNIQNGKIEPDNSITISEEKFSELNKYRLTEGDVIIGRRGEMGRSALVTNIEDGWLCGTGSLYLKLNACSEPSFISKYVRSKFFKDYLSNNARGTTMKNLNATILSNSPVPILSKKEQIQIVSEIESRFSVVDQLEQTIRENLQKAEALRQSILKKAFEGRLVKEVIAKQQYQKSPQKLYKNKATDLHAGILAKIIDSHYQNEKHLNKLNHVKCEKIIHMIESHIGVDLQRQPVKDAAGPDDYNRLKKVEHRANKKNWFAVDESLGGKLGYGYKPKKNIGYIIRELKETENLPLQEINEMISLFLPMDKERAEVVATLYASWNNFLIDSYQPTDEEIVTAARENWSKQKLNIKRKNFFKALEWMRNKKLIPAGKGKYVEEKAA